MSVWYETLRGSRFCSELSPGNVIELGVQPEQGVSLVIDGKVVGRGELLQVGDILGVKILETGK